MKCLKPILFSLLLALSTTTAAFAADECKHPLSEWQTETAKAGVEIIPLSAEQQAEVLKVISPPPITDTYTIAVMKKDDQAKLLVVVGGCPLTLSAAFPYQLIQDVVGSAM